MFQTRDGKIDDKLLKLIVNNEKRKIMIWKRSTETNTEILNMTMSSLKTQRGVKKSGKTLLLRPTRVQINDT